MKNKLKTAAAEPIYANNQRVRFKLQGETVHIGKIESYYGSDGYYISSGRDYHLIKEKDIVGVLLSLGELYSKLCSLDRDDANDLYRDFFDLALEGEGFNSKTIALINCEAYDRGHSAGVCEIVGISVGICDFVKDILKANL